MADAAPALPLGKRARLDADGAPNHQIAAAAAAATTTDPPLPSALSLEAFIEADTNKDGWLDRAEFLELAAAWLCPSAGGSPGFRLTPPSADG